MSAYDYISTRATLIIAVIMAMVGFVLGRQRYRDEWSQRL